MKQTSGSYVHDDGPFLRAAVRLMLFGLAVMVLALFCLYFAPLQIAPFISLGLYSVLWGKERQLGVFSPVTRFMTAFYAVLSLARVFAADIAWSAYAAPMVYLFLAVLVFGLLAVGRPFTMYYSKGAGFYPLHRKMSLMWGSLHALAGISSIVLMPSLWFLLVPMVLMLAGAVGTIWLNFISMGRAYGRQKSFTNGRFRFEQVCNDAQRDQFYSTIAEAYHADLQRAAGPRRRIDTATIEAEHRTSDAQRKGYTVPFLVYEGTRPIGGICMFLDHPQNGLPIESEASISVDQYRKKGRVVEMGRLGIHQRYRLERSVLTGLFKCVVEAAAERRAHTIMNDSFSFQVKLYSKIGFNPISEAPYRCGDQGSTGYGLMAQPMAMDLAKMVRLDQTSTTSSEVRDVLQPYVIERFFKILALQEIAEEFRLLRGPVWSKSHVTQ